MSSSWKRLGARCWPPLILLAFFLVAAEMVCRLGWIPEYLFAPPSAVFHVLTTNDNEVWGALLETTLSALAGLLLSFVLGNALAISLSLSTLAKRAFLPYATFFQTVPVIAIAPLLVIWLGFGAPTVIACSFIVSLFPVIASGMLGLESTDPALLDLFALYRATRWQRLWRLQLPFALPQIFSGLRIASGLAVIGAIVGEFIGGGGLGAVVDEARTRQRIDVVFAAVLVSSLVGWLFVVIIDGVAWRSLRHWHASARR